MLASERSKISSIMIRSNREFLPNNFLDRQVQAFLRPLESSLATFLQSKFTIKDDLITPNRFVYTIASFLVVITVFVTVFILNLQNFLDDYGWTNSIYKISFVIVHIISFLKVIIVVFKNKFDSERSVQLVILLQEVINKVKYCNFNIKDLIIGNWVTTIFVFGTSVGPIVLVNLFFELGVSSLTTYYFTIFDITTMYATRMLAFLRRCIDVWLEEIRMRSSMRLAELDGDWDTVQNAFYNLSVAYIAHRKLFLIPVSNFIFMFRVRGMFIEEIAKIKNIH